MTPIAVVAGILIDSGKILIAQRREGGNEALKWEFPGGKIEAGETPEQALERELLEEMGVKTRTGRIFDAKIRTYADGRSVLILFYRTRLIDGEPQPLEHKSLTWTERESICAFDFAGADRLVAERIFSEGLSAGNDI